MTTTLTRTVTEVHEFSAKDGFPLNLHHVTGPTAPTKGPVLLVHGAGVRADIFRPPEPTTFVDVLVGAGYDVWLENWRASIDLAPNEWTLDQAAEDDHPAGVAEVLRLTEADSLKAVVHCQGSSSFVLSAVSGLLPDVSVIVSNAMSLHPVIPALARLKIHYATPVVARHLDYLDPQWGLEAPHDPWARALTEVVRLTHHECDNLVCKLVSFTYGTGFPALWSHDNLSAQTHDWLSHEFAQVPFTFFAQMDASVRAGHLVRSDGTDPTAGPPRTDARFALLAGADNRCFLPESQERTFAWLDGHAPGRHALHVLPGYGHLDVFLGERAADDVFPLILEELDR